MDAIVAWGDQGQIANRIMGHLQGGADHVLLQPLSDLVSAVAQLEELAPAVLRA